MKKLLIPMIVLALLVGCSKKDKEEVTTGDTTTEETVDSKSGELERSETGMPNLTKLDLVDGPEGMKYIILKEGKGGQPGDGETAVVHYTGWFEGGKKFDSSVDRGKYFEFPVGRSKVIRGWDLGVADMRIGEKRLMVLPGNLAYGPRGYPGVIPPNATLIFEVELFDIK